MKRMLKRLNVTVTWTRRSLCSVPHKTWVAGLCVDKVRKTERLRWTCLLGGGLSCPQCPVELVIQRLDHSTQRLRSIRKLKATRPQRVCEKNRQSFGRWTAHREHRGKSSLRSLGFQANEAIMKCN